MKKVIVPLLLFLFLTTFSKAQNRLVFHAKSVNSLLEWMHNGCNKKDIAGLTTQPATQIMEQLLKGEDKNAPDFKTALEEFNRYDSTSGSVYLLNRAYRNRQKITKLLSAIKKTDFATDVYKRAIHYFPNNYIPPRNYNVFLTAVGWQWGDAMTFKYMVKNGKYSLSEHGTPAIIFNLTIVRALYGKTLPKQVENMENVMSHEMFHAILYDYIKTHWHSWDNKNVKNDALFSMFNEGMAHYIANGNILRKKYHIDSMLRQREKMAFHDLSDSAKVIFKSKNIEKEQAALNAGLYGKYWNKYICMTGMFMVYHIEQYYGAKELTKCIENGPIYFIKKYEALQKTNTEFPALPDEIIKYVEKSDHT